MKRIIKPFAFLFLMFGFAASVFAAGDSGFALSKAHNNLKDKASLQRGAQLYMNYCMGCHSLEYSRYIQLGEYLGIKDEEGQVNEKLIQNNLNFVTNKVTDKMTNSMPKEDAEKWFGVAPPDLTLVTRTRGKDWLYSYLKAFYVDESRPWGVNNAVFPDVGMPHILLPLQGKQNATMKTVYLKDDQGNQVEMQVIDKLELTQKGELDEKGYDQALTDLVNFLEYIGEPVKEKRMRIGVFVLLFLIILSAFLYALKREFWKDVH